MTRWLFTTLLAAVPAALLGAILCDLPAGAQSQMKANALRHTNTGTTFSCLAGGCSTSPPLSNGTSVYCANCSQTQVCASGGTGAYAQRIAGVWNCARGGNFKVTDGVPDPLYINQIIGSGTTPSITGMSVGGAIDVTAYGAKGDGVTDDSAAFGAVEAALTTSGGGTVWIPPGVYLTNNLVPPANSTWVGAGRNGSGLSPVTEIILTGTDSGLCAGGANGGVQVFANGVQLHHLQIDISSSADLDCALNASQSGSTSLGNIIVDDIYITTDSLTPAGPPTDTCNAIGNCNPVGIYTNNVTSSRFQNIQIAGKFRRGWLTGTGFMNSDILQSVDDTNGNSYNLTGTAATTVDNSSFPELDFSNLSQAGNLDLVNTNLELGPNGMAVNSSAAGPINVVGSYGGDLTHQFLGGGAHGGLWGPGIAASTLGQLTYPAGQLTGCSWIAASNPTVTCAAVTGIYQGETIYLDGAGTSGARLKGGVSSCTVSAGYCTGITFVFNGTTITAVGSGGTADYPSYAGHCYEAVVAGTTGTAPPSWPTSSQATVTDGSVTWMEDGECAWLSTTSQLGTNFVGPALAANVVGIAAPHGSGAAGLVISGGNFLYPSIGVWIDGPRGLSMQGNTMFLYDQGIDLTTVAASGANNLIASTYFTNSVTDRVIENATTNTLSLNYVGASGDLVGPAVASSTMGGALSIWSCEIADTAASGEKHCIWQAPKKGLRNPYFDTLSITYQGTCSTYPAFEIYDVSASAAIGSPLTAVQGNAFASINASGGSPTSEYGIKVTTSPVGCSSSSLDTELIDIDVSVVQ